MMIHPVYLPPWPRGSAKIPFALTLLVFARDKNVTKYLAEVLAFEARQPQVCKSTSPRWQRHGLFS